MVCLTSSRPSYRCTWLKINQFIRLCRQSALDMRLTSVLCSVPKEVRKPAPGLPHILSKPQILSIPMNLCLHLSSWFWYSVDGRSFKIHENHSHYILLKAEVTKIFYFFCCVFFLTWKIWLMLSLKWTILKVLRNAFRMHQLLQRTFKASLWSWWCESHSVGDVSEVQMRKSCSERVPEPHALTNVLHLFFPLEASWPVKGSD